MQSSRYNEIDDRRMMLRSLWHGLILLLSIYVLAEVSVEIIVPLSADAANFLEKIDSAICVVFLIDFFVPFYFSRDKKKFLKIHWIDLASAIPYSMACRSLRIFRAFRLIRATQFFVLLGGLKGVFPLVRFVKSSKLHSVLFSYICVLMILSFYCSLAFYSFEKGVNPNLREYYDACWWSYATVTTIGYGDIYPVTPMGRLIAGVLSLSGMGLFSLVTAEISTYFMSAIKNEEAVRNQETLRKDFFDPDYRNFSVSDGFSSNSGRNVRFLETNDRLKTALSKAGIDFSETEDGKIVIDQKHAFLP